jgi:hypothetical protein
MAERERGDFFARGMDECIAAEHKPARSQPGQLGEGRLDVLNQSPGGGRPLRLRRSGGHGTYSDHRTITRDR